MEKKKRNFQLILKSQPTKKNQFKAQLVQNGPKGTDIDRVDRIGPKWT